MYLFVMMCFGLVQELFTVEGVFLYVFCGSSSQGYYKWSLYCVVLRLRGSLVVHQHMICDRNSYAKHMSPSTFKAQNSLNYGEPVIKWAICEHSNLQDIANFVKQYAIQKRKEYLLNFPSFSPFDFLGLLFIRKRLAECTFIHAYSTYAKFFAEICI